MTYPKGYNPPEHKSTPSTTSTTSTGTSPPGADATSDDSTIIPSSFPGPLDKALIEFGKTTILNSLNVLKDFISFMVPLTTGLITAYIALLQFMGIKEIADVSLALKSGFIWPPLFMFLSLISFVFASFPVPRLIAAGNPSSIKQYRQDTFVWKYIGSTAGSIFFIAGVISMVLTIVPWTSGPKQEITEQLLIYENDKYDYKIRYPSYWSIKILNHSKDVTMQPAGDSSGPLMHVGVQEFSSLPKLHEYVPGRSHILNGNSSTTSLLANMPSYTIHWSNATKSGIEIVCIVNSRGYLVDYVVDKSDFYVYLHIAQKIIESFEFKDRP